jgi:hypothetical protein
MVVFQVLHSAGGVGNAKMVRAAVSPGTENRRQKTCLQHVPRPSQQAKPGGVIRRPGNARRIAMPRE